MQINFKRALPGSNIQGIDMMSREGKAECWIGKCQEHNGAIEVVAQVEQAHGEDHRTENTWRKIQTIQLGASEHRADEVPKCFFLSWLFLTYCGEEFPDVSCAENLPGQEEVWQLTCYDTTDVGKQIGEARQQSILRRKHHSECIRWGSIPVQSVFSLKFSNWCVLWTWRCDSVVEFLSGMHKVLGSAPSPI